MNNEEKILSMLDVLAQGQAKLVQGQAKLEQGQAKLEQGFAETNTRLDKLEQGQAKLEQGFAETNTRLDKLEQRVAKTEILIENTVIPQLKLLAEGHTAIQRQIRDLSVIDRMQDDIITLKAAVKYLSGEVERLGKAV